MLRFSWMSLGRLLRQALGRRSPRIGLALGGGGARGLAHVGVLQVLEEHDIPIGLIVGSSMGAIVGGAYAQDPHAETLRKRIVQYIQSREEDEERVAHRVMHSPEGRFSRWANSLRQYHSLTRDLQQSSLLDQEPLRRTISSLLEDTLIEQAKIPFSAVAVDLLLGEVVILDRGPIREAVEASAAIPGVFPPAKWNDRLLVDGGVSSLVPVEEAHRLEASVVIAVDVSQSVEQEPAPERGIDLLFRADEIARAHLKELQLRQADLVIRPQIGPAQWFEFAHFEQIIASGEKAARESLEGLKRLLP
jgi:NTE family protein